MWMNLENIMLTKISQIFTDEYHMISQTLSWILSIKQKQRNQNNPTWPHSYTEFEKIDLIKVESSMLLIIKESSYERRECGVTLEKGCLNTVTRKNKQWSIVPNDDYNDQYIVFSKTTMKVQSALITKMANMQSAVFVNYLDKTSSQCIYNLASCCTQCCTHIVQSVIYTLFLPMK